MSESKLQAIPGSTAAAAAAAPQALPSRHLTNREIQVLRLLADGLSSREVAARLAIGFKTATSHRNNILTKLGVHDTISAVRWAIRTGIVTP